MRDPEATLRQHALPVTAQRVAVLRAVSQHPHATADDLAESVRGELGTISRQSVYNVLNVLTDKGIIRNHHHLVCRSCGKTEDVCCAVGDAPCLTAHSHHGFKIDEAEVIYWGTCPACQQKPRD
ncbi:MAG: hypothetical protein RJB43_1475 [Verrucomicrobiota bacterium]